MQSPWNSLVRGHSLSRKKLSGKADANFRIGRWQQFIYEDSLACTEKSVLQRPYPLKVQISSPCSRDSEPTAWSLCDRGSGLHLRTCNERYGTNTNDQPTNERSPREPQAALPIR